MAVTDKIHIDFQFLSTGDPKVLVIMDTSTWSYIENKPSIIEIIPPGTDKITTYSFLKNRANVFNTSNLFFSPIAVYNDLPDGIYKITVKGSPSTFCKQRDILKTDKTKLELYKLYASLGLGSEGQDSNTLKIIEEVKFLIDSAEALVSVGESFKAMNNLKLAMKQLKDFAECKDCS